MCAEILAWLSTTPEAPVNVTLIKWDKMSHVKECRNSCSFANSGDVEWSRRREVMKKHRTHLIAFQMVPLHTPSPLTDLTLIELVKAIQTRAVRHTVFIHPDLSMQQIVGDKKPAAPLWFTGKCGNLSRYLNDYSANVKFFFPITEKSRLKFRVLQQPDVCAPSVHSQTL